jgi:hypothetical protein
VLRTATPVKLAVPEAERGIDNELAVKAPFIESLQAGDGVVNGSGIYAVSVIVAEAFRTGLPFASRACTTGWLARAIPAIPDCEG